ncbi:copper resistance protein NlpE N-terminal domain-containing protein [Polaribacter sp. MSW13]|uniref:Copper resistance protein NlpE N-terminal domain-containing protein n=1 Tax=Polaribacter marinus TaxID=2916838 RepID=A0A9X1VJY7_9FLAO|nr:copper resistance protein NlpE [Polaribacter marinus]MCI2227914.1 copper resistance protein NlpE N-terminal domain-containing protein [Polaribacter marinus]
MKEILKVLVVACFLFSSCISNEVKNITGIYKGEFPCGDCAGIDNKMTLNADSTFVLEKMYKGKGNDSIFKETGKYTVKEGKLFLELKQSPFKYEIRNNYIELLDIDGHKIESELNYKLIKQE